ncbi:MAG: HlyC/CorC family transporter [Firmicutes bacterium]|nr:HlyC/CorC family transporter [Bacillota bacterium]MBQ3964693.1 HlyC/CorC family transporter [Bacillota bacterium]
MDLTQDPLILAVEIVIILALLVMLALINAADKAIDACGWTAVRQLADDGDKRAKRLLLIFNKPSNYMAAAKILMVFCSTVAGALILMRLFAKYAADDNDMFMQGRGIIVLLIAAVVFALVIVSFVIILPRQLAQREPEKTALALSGYALFFSRLCRPFVVLSRGLAGGFLKMLGKGGYEEEDEFSEDEVMTMLEVGQETGVLKEEGRKMIDSIFAFDDKLAYEIMTPRTDVFMIDIGDEPSEYEDELMQLTYTRVPVYEDDSDNIIGILNIKDYLIQARENGFDKVNIREILRKPFFVPDTKNIDSLFYELQKTKQHIAVLIDEYGGFAGIVTMEDIIEEVMGEIDDEFDEEEPEIKKINYNTYIVDGNMDLDDLNEEVGSDFESDYSETIGGYLIDMLGEIPADGDQREMRFGRYVCRIEEVRDRRIERVRLTIRDEEDLEREAKEKEAEENGHGAA